MTSQDSTMSHSTAELVAELRKEASTIQRYSSAIVDTRASCINRAATRLEHLERALTDARGYVCALATLLATVTGHDSIMAQEALERIDRALNQGTSK